MSVSRSVPARLAAAVVALALAGVIAGCSTPEPSVETPQPTASTPAAEPTDDATGEPGQTFGCSPAILEFLPANGFPDSVPIDPTEFEFPRGITVDATPECLVRDEYGGAERFGAFFPGDGQAALAAIGASLSQAGYVQSPDYGPLVWFVGGDDPIMAEHSVGAGPQTIGGAPYLWVTY